MMDEPIAFEKWRTRAEATVNLYVSFDVEFDGAEQRAMWSAKGNIASARVQGATITAVDYLANGAAAAPAEERRYPCTKDGARLAGEQIAEFLRTGKLAKE